MRFIGYTDANDFHWRTLLAMMARPSFWSFGVTWREWRLSAVYTWHDGPIFLLRSGPVWVVISDL